MNIAEAEAHLFMITEKMLPYYDNSIDKVEVFLRSTLTYKHMDKAFFDRWLRGRYKKIKETPEVQVVLLKNAGYTYRQIQLMVKKAPNTIRSILANYDIKHQVDHETEVHLTLIGERLRIIQSNLQEKGMELV